MREGAAIKEPVGMTPALRGARACSGRAGCDIPRHGGCACQSGQDLSRRIRTVFQPIFRLGADGVSVLAQEALARGTQGEPAGTILAALHEVAEPHLVDQACRLAAIEEAARQGLQHGDALLSLNMLPNAGVDPRSCIGSSVAAALRHGFRPDQLLFELTEVEEVRDIRLLKSIVAAERSRGVRVALDDFGAGHSGLGLLAALQPDIVKIDMNLVRDVDSDHARRAVIRAILLCCGDLGILPIAEGVETAAELETLRGLGLGCFQGFLLARPRAVAGFRPEAGPGGPALPPAWPAGRPRPGQH